MTRPEQSNAFGPVAPHTYGFPRWLSAARSARSPSVLPPGILIRGNEPVRLKMAMARLNAAAFSLFILALMALVLACVFLARAVTTRACCLAVSRARGAALPAAGGALPWAP